MTLLAAALFLSLLQSPPATPETAPDEGLDAVRPLIERFRTDRDALRRRYRVPMSPHRRQRMRRFLEEWRARLAKLDFDALSHDARVDYVLFRHRLDYDLRRLDEEAKREEEIHGLVPFWGAIVGLAEARRQMETPDPAAAAATVDALAERVEKLRDDLGGGEGEAGIERSVARRAAGRTDDLRRTLEAWFRFYEGYDPEFSWWVRKPHARADEALKSYAQKVREKLVDRGDDSTLIGDPIGEDALRSALDHEMIAYSPAELIDIAEREMAWCDARMDEAARELGFDDWRRAQDHVKSLHAAPGHQPELIRDLAREAIDFLEKRRLVTIPELCKEIWRMEMMSPERQRTSPYFLGGEVIQVSFPTDTMAHADKLMSLRGNNIHFARATVHHELIPGHHLQGFMTARHRTWRRLFRTPFWIEGWALYWEMQLWDLGFPRSPEDRIGMLFWRKHRCARIIFSLSFHLKRMTAREAVDFLVERVGHEPNNAEAEVRRSVGGDYGPLYQAAYMLGGLQLRALHRKLVDSGEWSNRRFHDEILRQGSIPIAMVRAALTEQPLTPDFRSTWRFAEEAASK